MAIFPTAVPTNGDLYIAINTGVTALTAGINNSTLTIPVVSTTGFPAVGAITIDGEIIHYTSVGPTQFNADARGFDGTAANSHLNGAQVNHFIIAVHHNILKDEIIAIAQNLSDRIGLGTTQIKAVNGTLALPSHSFANDLDSGMYLAGANNIVIGTGATSCIDISPTTTVLQASGSPILQILSQGLRNFSNGSAAAPTIHWSGDADTGIYHFGAGSIGMSTGGNPRFEMNNSYLLINSISGATSFMGMYGTNIGFDNVVISRNNDATNANSRAGFTAVAASTLADAYYHCTNQTTEWIWGLDNSDSDSWKLSRASVLGTNDALVVDTGNHVQFIDGTSTAPAITFISQPTMGWRRVSANKIAYSAGTVDMVTIDTSSLDLTNNASLVMSSGNAAGPILAHRTNTDSGFYWPTTTSIGFSADGTAVATIRGDNSVDLGLYLNRGYLKFGTAAGSGGDGTAAQPILSWESDIDTGLYRIAANHIGFSTGGTLRWQIDSSGALAVLGGSAHQILAAAGSAAVPAYSFNVAGGTDSGIYLTGTGSIRFSSDGTNTVSIVATGLELGIDGTVSNPSINWGVDPDTGLFRSGANQLDVVTGGTMAIRVETPTNGVSIRGVTSAVAAAAGFVGEVVTSAVGATNAAATGQFSDTTSISLTAGDWDIIALGDFENNGATWQEYNIGIGDTAGNSGSGTVTGQSLGRCAFASTSTAHINGTMTVYKRLNLSATTTVYLKQRFVFSAGTPRTAGSSILARRRR